MLCLVYPDEPSPDNSYPSQLTVPNQVVNADSSPETSPVRPLPRSASTVNLQSASKLILSSKLVYSKRLDLPHGVEVIRATPSAGLNCFVAKRKRMYIKLPMFCYVVPRSLTVIVYLFSI